jgi:hypothetical protein
LPRAQRGVDYNPAAIMNRRRCLALFSLATLACAAAACSAPAQPPVPLAQDKPTLLYFFTDN